MLFFIAIEVPAHIHRACLLIAQVMKFTLCFAFNESFRFSFFFNFFLTRCRRERKKNIIKW